MGSTDFPPAPSLDARVESLERLSMVLHARVAELGQDMKMSFGQQARLQVQSEEQISGQIAELGEKLAGLATKEELAGLATKEELAATEGRILDSFNQLLKVINERLPPPEQATL